MINETENKSASAKVVQLPVSKQERRRAEDKFGVAVMKHGYTMLPNLFLQAQGRLGIGHGEFNVLVQIISHWWEADKDPYPTKETIARRMGLSGRQIQRYLTKLEKAELIQRVERFTGRKAQTANGYSLDGLVKKLIEIEPEFRKAVEQKRNRQKKVETK